MSRVGSVCLAVVCVFCSLWDCGRPLYVCLPVLCVPFGWSCCQWVCDAGRRSGVGPGDVWCGTCLGVLVTGFSMVSASHWVSMGALW